ncbi:hypothetical protein WJX73_004173 [Symbiochloris irregularis]|uniref:Uncharacterized protein n=1 Tax=Symbiochloris irregularis TaxID=706552 RepID=A0AAW1NPG4_9CHLO
MLAAPFDVKFQGVHRSLSRTQLEKAPDSLLSTVLLGDGLPISSVGTLEIPSGTASSGLPGWADGTKDLFQICIDCYSDVSDRVQIQSARPLLPATIVKQALDFFGIPEKLWPLGVWMAMQTVALRQEHSTHLKKLMVEAAKSGGTCRVLAHATGVLLCLSIVDQRRESG